MAACATGAGHRPAGPETARSDCRTPSHRLPFGCRCGPLLSYLSSVGDELKAEERPHRRYVLATTKVIFVAFAIEDERQRDFLKGQSLHPRAPFEFIDMSVKQAYDSDWKVKVRTRILRSDGVIVLVSKNSLTSSGQRWEIQCALEEGKPIRGIWAYKDDRTAIDGVPIVTWSDDHINSFIDAL